MLLHWSMQDPLLSEAQVRHSDRHKKGTQTVSNRQLRRDHWSSSQAAAQ